MRIHGTIRNSKNNTPVEGAVISINIENSDIAFVSSDEHGKFEYNTEIDYIGKTLNLSIKKDGFEKKNIFYEIDRPEIQQDVLLEEHEARVREKREKKVKISGKILIDKTDAPLETADITIKIDNETKEIVSKKDGSFSFNVSRQHLDDFIEYKATKEGYKNKSGKIQLKDIEDGARLEIKLSPKLPPKKEKIKLKKELKDEIKKPGENATANIDIGKDGSLSFNVSSLPIPAKIAIIIVAVIAIVSYGLPAIQQYSQQQLLSISPDPISFNLGNIGAGETISRTFSILNTGRGTPEWAVNADQPWISISPRNGTGSGAINIDVNTSGLQPGSHSGIITVSSNLGTKSGAISLNIVPTPTPTQLAPKLNVSQDVFRLKTNSKGEPNIYSFKISNGGGGTLEWSISADKPWIEISPRYGTNSKTVTITANTAGLQPGSHAGIVTVESNGGTEKLSVNIDVLATPASTTPAPATSMPAAPIPTMPASTTPAPTLIPTSTPTPSPTPSSTFSPSSNPTIIPAPAEPIVTESPSSPEPIVTESPSSPEPIVTESPSSPKGPIITETSTTISPTNDTSSTIVYS